MSKCVHKGTQNLSECVHKGTLNLSKCVHKGTLKAPSPNIVKIGERYLVEVGVGADSVGARVRVEAGEAGCLQLRRLGRGRGSTLRQPEAEADEDSGGQHYLGQPSFTCHFSN